MVDVDSERGMPTADEITFLGLSADKWDVLVFTTLVAVAIATLGGMYAHKREAERVKAQLIDANVQIAHAQQKAAEANAKAAEAETEFEPRIIPNFIEAANAISKFSSTPINIKMIGNFDAEAQFLASQLAGVAAFANWKSEATAPSWTENWPIAKDGVTIHYLNGMAEGTALQKEGDTLQTVINPHGATIANALCEMLRKYKIDARVAWHSTSDPNVDARALASETTIAVRIGPKSILPILQKRMEEAAKTAGTDLPQVFSAGGVFSFAGSREALLKHIDDEPCGRPD